MSPMIAWPAPRAMAGKSRIGFLTGMLMIYVALIPFQYQSDGMIAYSGSDIILALTALLAFPNLRYRREHWSVWHYALLAIFALSSLAVAMREGGLPKYVYLNKDTGLIILFLGYAFLTSAATNWRTIRLVMRAFIVSVVLQNLAGLVAWVASARFGIDSILVADNGLRLAGLMGDANAYGGLVATALVLCEGACSSGEPLFGKKFLIFARLTLAAGILVCFSRTTWISLGLVFAFLFVTRFATAIRALFLLLSGFAVMVILMGGRFLALFENLAFRPEVSTGAGRTRYDLISTALDRFVHHPFFGIGVGTFYEQQDSIIHNTPVWILTEFGVIGFGVFAGFLCWLAWRAYDAYRLAPPREKPVVFGLILGFVCMMGMSLGIEAFYQRHWWLIFALIAASYSVARRQRRPRLMFPAGFSSLVSRSVINV